jgi:hypothetical protein
VGPFFVASIADTCWVDDSGVADACGVDAESKALVIEMGRVEELDR